MAQRISVIGDDDVEDFHAAIRDLGYNEAEFELTEAPVPTPAGPPSGVTGTVQ